MTPLANWIMRWRVRVGYPVALAFLAFANPTPASYVAGTAFITAGILVRAVASGYLYKHERLATAGPYALTRNPLYLGSGIIAAGFALCSASWIGATLVAAYFLAFYPAVMRSEELELRARYGAAFEDYARRVPRFWPRLTLSAPPSDSSAPAPETFSWAQYFRNREIEAAIGAAAGLAILATRKYWMHLL
jgi:protein-S-isoprenylcysteine O-methyltransferase Ste14